MVMKPRLMPYSRLRTFAVTERAFVVHEPLLTMVCVFGSYSSWFTPMLTVMSSPLPGALMMTFFAPPCRCPRAFSAWVKRPVDSMTRSTPASCQGMMAGSRSANTFTVQALIRSSPSRALTRPGKCP